MREETDYYVRLRKQHEKETLILLNRHLATSNSAFRLAKSLAAVAGVLLFIGAMIFFSPPRNKGAQKRIASGR